MGAYKHQWIAPKKKELGESGIKKQLAELYPNMKLDEIEVMVRINDKKELQDYLKNIGKNH
jgi:hypothetical protein